MYKKITLICKNDPNLDSFEGGTYSVEYDNASLEISGNHLIISSHMEDDESNGYLIGNVINLNIVESYKLV